MTAETDSGADANGGAPGWGQPDHPVIRHKIGGRLIVAAWGVEIIAALIGLFIALITALATHSEIVAETGREIDAAGLLSVFIGALPFIMVAIVELMKIPLATAYYFSLSIYWKAIFVISLLLLIIITFETMLNGFQRNFESRVYVITEKKTELLTVNEEISLIESENERLSSVTGPMIQSEFDAIKEEIRINRTAELSAIDKQKQDLLSSISQGSTDALGTETQRIRDKISKLQNDMQQEISRLEAAYRSESDGQINKSTVAQESLTQRIEAVDARLRQLNVEYSKEMDSCFICAGVRERFEPQIKRLQDEKEGYVADLRRISSGSEANTLRNKFNSEMQAVREKFQANINSEESRLSQIIKEIDSRESRDRKSLAPQLQALDASRTEVIEKFDVQEREAQERYKSKVSDLDAAGSKIAVNQEALSPLFDQQRDLRSAINLKAKDNQIYQIAALWYEREAPVDVTKEELKVVSVAWFGSLSFIVAVTGTILAFGGLVLRYHDKRTHLSWKEAFRPIAITVARFFRSLRGLVIDFRKRVRQPKIKFVTKVVEVPKEVIKEVPVDKVVYKEVPKEVVKKELVYVPLFTNDKDLLNIDYSAGAEVPGRGK